PRLPFSLRAVIEKAHLSRALLDPRLFYCLPRKVVCLGLEPVPVSDDGADVLRVEPALPELGVGKSSQRVDGVEADGGVDEAGFPERLLDLVLYRGVPEMAVVVSREEEAGLLGRRDSKPVDAFLRQERVAKIASLGLPRHQGDSGISFWSDLEVRPLAGQRLRNPHSAAAEHANQG